LPGHWIIPIPLSLPNTAAIKIEIPGPEWIGSPLTTTRPRRLFMPKIGVATDTFAFLNGEKRESLQSRIK